MNLTPREIVAALDHHIIGQHAAKRAVAIAIRNRWRRKQIDPDFAREVTPRNIIMIGPTGVGKTEIARRLATLTGAPFIKVEASKYTEVGYHGRDVESMIRDLLDLAVNMVRQEHAEIVKQKAETAVEERLVSILLGDDGGLKPVSGETGPPLPQSGVSESWGEGSASSTATLETKAHPEQTTEPEQPAHNRVRARMLEKLRSGDFDKSEIEISIREKQALPIISMMGPEQMDPGMANMLENIIPDRNTRRRVTVPHARRILMEEETEKLLDTEKIIEEAVERTEQSGMIFLDEIDKIAISDGKSGADVSRQGVQRDLLPIVEGSAVNTRQGIVHTDQILFIAAGAFHACSVSDLMPELQGRFPIRVELDALTKDDFRRILTEPDAALTKQQQALLAPEGLTINFDDAALDAMAELAAQANSQLENIGARRLMTVIECIFEEISFDAPQMKEDGKTEINITEPFVRERVENILQNEDLTRFVL